MTRGVALLLVFTPFAFGTVEPWSISVMELGAFGLFLLEVGTRGITLPHQRPARTLLGLFLLLTGLALLQTVPLPDGILQLVSPASLATWRKFGGDALGTFHTISMYPDATRQELLKVLAYAAVFAVVVRQCRTRARVMVLVRTILFMGGLLAVLAIVQKMTWNGRILWFYPVDESLRSGFRIWGPYVNHNHFAGYLEMALPLGLALLVYTAPQGTSAPGEIHSRRFGRFLTGKNLVPFAGISLLVLLMSACLLASLSRGAIAASVVAWLAFIWMTWSKRSLRKKALQLTLTLAAFCAVILPPAWERIAQRFEDIEEKNQVSRLYVLADSLGIVRDYSLFGTGLGTFEQSYRRYQSRYPRLTFDHAHNDYLEIATDTGAVGFLLAAAMVVIFSFSLIRGWRRRHNHFSLCIGAGGISSCIAIAVHSATDFNLHIPANALLFTVIAGLTHAAIFSPACGSGPGRSEDIAPPRRSARAPTLLVLLATGMLLYLPARALRADHYYRQVARFLDDGTTAELDVKPLADDTMPSYLKAVDSLKQAAALEPARASYPQALSDLHAALGEWATAMASLNAPLPAGVLSGSETLALAAAEARRAIALDPTNPDLHLALGRLLAALDGDLGRADAQIRLALASHPASARLRFAAAMLYLLGGSKASALEQARVLANLDDGYLISDAERKTFQSERRTPSYLSRRMGSYLFQALEIAWRASGDIDLVKTLAPRNDDAEAVVEIFLEWKGLEQ